MTADRHVAALARRLMDGVEGFVAEQFRRSDAETPRWRAEYPELAAAAAEISRESFLAELEALCDGGRLPDECPPTDRDFARLGGALGWPLHEGVIVYQRAHEILWEAWLAEVEVLAAPADVRAEVLRRGSRFFFAYADQLGRLMTTEYMEERERALRTREQRRAHLVRELLDGADVDAGELDYPLAAGHVGVVAWGEGAAEALRALADAADRRLLAVEVAGGRWWGWLGGRRPLRGLPPLPPGDARLALGRESAGADGFRTTHEQALAAARLADGRTERVVTFDSVALEALALADEHAARAFVAAELAGIDGDDARSAALRQTLRAWFRAGHNAAAAAAALGVHEQTVAARIRAAEERLGRAPAARRAELETALRLHEALGVDTS